MSKREALAREERIQHLLHAVSCLAQDCAAALLDDSGGGGPHISRTLGKVQYVTELMVEAGDLKPEIIMHGMFQSANGFSGVCKYQPMSLMQTILDRFSPAEEPLKVNPDEAPEEAKTDE